MTASPLAQPGWRATAACALALALALAFAGCAAPASPPSSEPAPTPAPSAAAQQAADVRQLAVTCINCHGAPGQAGNGIALLHGQSANRLAQRLRDFKAGKAPDGTVMTRLAKGYEDQQIDALAQWFAKGGQP